MDYMVDPDGLSFNSIEDEVVLDNDKPESHTGASFLIGYFAHKGIRGDTGQAFFNLFSHDFSFMIKSIKNCAALSFLDCNGI